MKLKLWLVVSILLLIAIYFGVTSYASNIAKKEVDKMIVAVSPFVDVDYKSVNVDFIGLDVKMSDVFIVSRFDTDYNVFIDDIIIRKIDGKSDIPTFMSGSIHGIDLKINDPDISADLEKFGYTNQLLVDLGIDYIYENNVLNVNDLSLSVDDVGELNANFSIGNLPFNQQGILGFLTMYPEILLYKAQVVLDLLPLADHLIEYGAKEHDMSIADFRSKVLEDIERGLDTNENIFLGIHAEIAKKFVTDREKFSISISPSEPYQQLGRILDTKSDELDNLNLRSE